MAFSRALHEKSFSAFEHFFLTIKKKSRGTITLRTATEISAKLTAGLFAPIFQQIDPMHLGEAFRATAISREYGRRLNVGSANLSEQALDGELIAGYPTHGFVIDRGEATALFENVREPNEIEFNLMAQLGDSVSSPLAENTAIRKYLSDEQKERVHDDAATENTEHPLQLGGNDQTPPNPKRRC